MIEDNTRIGASTSKSTTMKYCTELVLSGRSSFEFACALPENRAKNIRQTGGSDRARAHQVLVEQLGTYSWDLRNLEKISLVADAQRVLIGR